MKLRRALVAVFGCLMFLGAVTGAKADTLDFRKAGATAIVPFKVIDLSKPRLTSFDDDIFIGLVFGKKNNLHFFPGVFNLVFKRSGARAADSVAVSAFQGPVLLGNTFVMMDRTLDFTAAGDIDQLFADASPAAGSGSGDVNSAPETTAVPEPCTIGLLGIGLAGVGFIRLRKTRNA